MKKMLLSTLAVCAIAVGGGYYFSVERFATEAANFKESLSESKVFSTQSITVDKYKFQVILDGISADLSGLVEEISHTTPQAEISDLPRIEIKTPIKLQYTPVLNKITMLIPDRNYDIDVMVAQQASVLNYIGDSGKTTFHLSQAPSLKEQSLINFVKQYVYKISNVAGQFVFKEKNSEHPIVSADQVYGVLTREPSDIGEKIVITSDSKGLVSNPNELLKSLSLLHPDMAKTGMVEFYNKSMLATQEEIRRDSYGHFIIDADFEKIITAFKSSTLDSTEDLFKAFTGTSLSINAKDKILGSTSNVDFKIQMPKSDTDGDAELTYHFKTTMTPQFQDFLVTAVFEKIKEFQPDMDLTEKALAAAFPDLVSLGEITFNLDAKGDMAKKIGNARLDMSALDYGIHAIVNSDGVNAVLKVIVHNYQELISNLQLYILKVVEHPEIAGLISPEMKTYILAFPEMFKTILQSMGKEETINGKQAMNIELTLPVALAAAMIASGDETRPALGNTIEP